MSRVPLLTISRLQKSYQSGTERIPVLVCIEMSLSEGSIAVVTGESGSGKSTLLNLIGGLDEPDSGTIHLNGTDLTEMSESDLVEHRSSQVGFVFQTHHLLNEFTALENIMLPRYIAGHPKKDAMEHARNWLERVGLQDRGSHYPLQMSGGERQRVVLARALINTPKLILADEPTGNLDEKNSKLIEALLFGIVEEDGRTMILVTHDERIAARAQLRYHLENGEIHLK